MPLGFGKGKRVYVNWKKILYNLKQSLRSWFDKFAKMMRKQGYQ